MGEDDQFRLNKSRGFWAKFCCYDTIINLFQLFLKQTNLKLLLK